MVPVTTLTQRLPLSLVLTLGAQHHPEKARRCPLTLFLPSLPTALPGSRFLPSPTHPSSFPLRKGGPVSISLTPSSCPPKSNSVLPPPLQTSLPGLRLTLKAPLSSSRPTVPSTPFFSLPPYTDTNPVLRSSVLTEASGHGYISLFPVPGFHPLVRLQHSQPPSPQNRKPTPKTEGDEGVHLYRCSPFRHKGLRSVRGRSNDPTLK